MATLLDISEVLGYPIAIDTRYPISASRMMKIDQCLLALDKVDIGLSGVVTDGMAEQVGDLRLNYSKHTALLRQEGSRLLNMIASLSGIPVLYDRFKAGSIRTVSFHNDYG
jgi:hypothetical protein